MVTVLQNMIPNYSILIMMKHEVKYINLRVIASMLISVPNPSYCSLRAGSGNKTGKQSFINHFPVS